MQEANPKWLNFLLFFLIGCPAWLLVSALFLQIPIYIQTTPEHYNIAAYLVVGVQVGNLFGFSVAGIQSCLQMPQKYLVLATLVFGLGVDIFIATGSHIVLRVFGTDRSVGLLIAFLCSGGVGSLSVISMFPFVAPYGPFLTSALSTGSGTSGFLLALLSLIQGPGSDRQLFSDTTYFYILISFFLVGIIALLIVIFSKPESFESPVQETSLMDSTETQEREPLDPNIWDTALAPCLNQFYISLMNYLVLGITPYLATGFKSGGVDVSTTIVFWLSLGSVFCGCVGRMLTLWIFISNLNIITLIQVLMWSYMILMCFFDHTGMSVAWAWLSVVVTGLYSGLYGFADTTNYNKIVLETPPQLIEKGSRYVGVSNQIGAVLGSFISFFLVLFYFE